MSLESWEIFLDSFRADHASIFYASKQDFKRFAAFAGQLPADERIPLLLLAYDRYRSLATRGDLDDAAAFETSCYSILISTILQSGFEPNQHEASEILRKSFHRCGH